MTEGTGVPLTSKVVIDKDEFLDIVDYLRVAIHDAMRRVKWGTTERDEMIGGSRPEDEEIVIPRFLRRK